MPTKKMTQNEVAQVWRALGVLLKNDVLFHESVMRDVHHIAEAMVTKGLHMVNTPTGRRAVKEATPVLKVLFAKLAQPW